MEKVREATRERGDVIIEGHGRFDLPTACHRTPWKIWISSGWRSRSCGHHGSVGRVETPDQSALSFGERLYALAVPHAAGIACSRLHPARRVARRRDHRVKKIAALAETHYIPICPHNPSGPVANAATLQLAACLPSFYLLETIQRRALAARRVRGRRQLIDGLMSIPTGPGLGVDICEEAIAQHLYQPTALRHYRGTLVDIRPPDAGKYY